MDSRTYLNKQLSMLARARLLSRVFFIIAALLVAAAFVFLLLQNAAVFSADEAVRNWEYFLLLTPLLDKVTLLIVFVSALVLVWMAYMLRALVTIAEIQCVDLNE